MRKAFTLIEMLIVIIIMSVVALMAFPKFRTISNHTRVNQATDVLRGQLELAGSSAMRTRKPVRLFIDSNKSIITISDRKTGEVLSSTHYGLDTDFHIETLTADNAQVDFYPNGLTSTGTTISMGIDEYVRKVAMLRSGQVILLAQ